MKTTTETTRKTFVFNTVWYEIIKDCPAQVKGEVFSAVMEYALFGKMPEGICNEANVIFLFIKMEIDRREKRRQRTNTPLKSLESLETLESLEASKPLPENRPLTRQQRRKLERELERKRLKMAS